MSSDQCGIPDRSLLEDFLTFESGDPNRNIAERTLMDRNGIVQTNRLGEKRRGRLEPDYLMPVLGGAITKW